MIDQSKVYLVGGAVRDKLMGLEPKDLDYVVVGVTPDEMLAHGFTQVGESFSVFLHPETGDEYALATRALDMDPAEYGRVTLEEDLLRRDLTINAMAMDADGKLIDPFNGRHDIDHQKLRAVSDTAFLEDPLRVMRAARFYARLKSDGFAFATDSTLHQMKEACNLGAWKQLAPERVWKEISRALMEASPSAFFDTLLVTGGLDHWFPEVLALIGVEQPPEHHPEGDVWTHVMMALDHSASQDADLFVRWAVLCHDLGKALTPEHKWPSHFGHEKAGVSLVTALSDRVDAPSGIRRLAECVCELHTKIHCAHELTPRKICEVVMAFDGLRRPHNLERGLMAARCDAQGRLGRENAPYTQADVLLSGLEAIKSVDVKAELASHNIKDKTDIPGIVHRARINAVSSALKVAGRSNVVEELSSKMELS